MAAYNLRQLRYFTAVVECGSVAEASRKLYIAQPSVSTAIRQLEESFNVQLFIRQHTNGMALTPAGARFYRKAQALLRMAHEFEQNALADNDVVAGQIDVGCYETVAPLYLPMLIAGFRARWPGVEVRIRDGDQQELIQALTGGSIDLAMLFEHDLDPSIETTPLMPPQQPYALLPAGHRFAGQAQVSLQDLVLEPMILLDTLPSRTYFMSIFTERGLTPHITFSSPSIEMVRGMVAQGFGFSILVTRPFADYSYDGREVACVPLAETVTGSGLAAAWLRRAQLTRPAQLFVEHCVSEFSRLKR
ncbi:MULTISPECIES: LysR family transcriptional regulator [unclassified Pseudomonas]|uniref:LysR family transcriptional regulator n=1 Tax=unclassified Pseudomonas TaxID=196821 RepID=UPI000BC41375|nr:MULTISPECIES: LysR family transcriptional regulator [unclassified Pseudomonas]PVZ20460.1 DNA-binding transcriptional LysR family regulator [Pseudomonas sp. URIL14HWK12:I12]PVZ27526.1 DNA-binding transcriptional LysR family regulator [Pseudomonas sp. URIL14HWK12:I10]PVZ38415.1 DNA-binding transcriptional LysR family regulator [Pseudomonas sp. URIL14HWK12:I11]SNZ03448.1 DNA-binding transcriptional regulator, LysR family [Pseudomonas sp. URIL14HWK12:I9]